MAAQFPLIITDTAGEEIAATADPAIAEVIAIRAGAGAGVLLFGRVVWTVPVFGWFLCPGVSAIADAMAEHIRLAVELETLEATMRERFPAAAPDRHNRGDRTGSAMCVHGVDLRSRCDQCPGMPAGYLTQKEALARIAAGVDYSAAAYLGDLPIDEGAPVIEAATGPGETFRIPARPIVDGSLAASWHADAIAPAERAGEFCGPRCIACESPFDPFFSVDGKHCASCYAGELGKPDDRSFAGRGLIGGAFDAEFGPK